MSVPKSHAWIGTCVESGKRSFADKSAAKKAAKATDRTLRVYRCTACDFWHAGHQRAGSREAYRWTIKDATIARSDDE